MPNTLVASLSSVMKCLFTRRRDFLGFTERGVELKYLEIAKKFDEKPRRKRTFRRSRALIETCLSGSNSLKSKNEVFTFFCSEYLSIISILQAAYRSDW
jgi:hypothetical protein